MASLDALLSILKSCQHSEKLKQEHELLDYTLYETKRKLKTFCNGLFELKGEREGEKRGVK